MSNENVTADEDDVAINVEMSDKNETDKNKGRHNFWPFGNSGDKQAKNEKIKEKSDRKKLKSSEMSDKEKVTAATEKSAKRRATLEPSASPSVSTTPRPTRYSI